MPGNLFGFQGNLYLPPKLFVIGLLYRERMLARYICFIISLAFISGGLAQEQESTVYGTLFDADSLPLPYSNVSVQNVPIGTVADDQGFYELNVPSGNELILVYSHVGFKTQKISFNGKPGERYLMNQWLNEELTSIEGVEVSAEKESSSTFVKIEIKDFENIPNTSGNFETILKTMGVSSNNELSSQYSVRGGNFDENLVYVNDIEIHRPFLIRSGQQEGLSFTNPDMVESVHFSAGGFDAQYGDKMSSVLDITYRKPKKFAASASASLLGGSAHVEGKTKNNKLTHITGVRYKTNRYLLGALETKGDYNPNFIDVQSYVTYKPFKKFEIGFLGNFADNQYNFIPQTLETSFGTVQDALSFKVFYDGNERDRFQTALGALSLGYRPNDELSLKIISSAFNTYERESFDIQGQYLINELDNRFGSETAGDSILNIGIGTFMNHARNKLEANVFSIEHKGLYATSDNDLRWGIQYRFESINDQLSEWDVLDSAGYSIPYSDSDVLLFNTRKGKSDLQSYRITGYLQNTYNFRKGRADYYVTTGLRTHYWSYNKQTVVSPRASLNIDPYWFRDFRFKFAAGYYYQPPFFRELRTPEGEIRKNIKAQRSIHFIAGTNYYFQAWDRPFKLSSELYFKSLSNLIPYKVDNVRIKYYPDYIARGYATGIEFKINGEFVEGSQSWASLTFLKTEEDIYRDFYIVDHKKYEPGYYSRPTDQLFNFTMFFQDYFPNNPDYKVHLNFVYASKMYVSQSNPKRLDVTFPLSAYKRVDLGVSKTIDRLTSQNRLFKSAWISAEVFNLLDIKNKISYLWIRTVSNQTGDSGYYAIPNFLTSRRINVKLSFRF